MNNEMPDKLKNLADFAKIKTKDDSELNQNERGQPVDQEEVKKIINKQID